tara:strand:- start:575 stop:1360 length:786 start_codon:yes stop_codon:yes gene_type:complete
MSLLYSPANTSREGLNFLATPPALGRFHKPYSFADYVNNVEESLDRAGLEVVNQEYEVTPDKLSLFGAMEVQPRVLEGELIPADSDYRLIVGVRGSHNQRIPRGLVLGSQVMVCSNLCFSGNIGQFNSKQTINLVRRLPRLISEVVSQIPELAYQQDQKFAAYKDYEFSNPRAGDAALVEIFRQGGLSAAQLGKAIREYDQPTYSEHAAHGKSAWLALNAVTEALKPTGANVNTHLIAQRTAIADRFLSGLVGLNTLSQAA